MPHDAPQPTPTQPGRRGAGAGRDCAVPQLDTEPRFGGTALEIVCTHPPRPACSPQSLGRAPPGGGGTVVEPWRHRGAGVGHTVVSRVRRYMRRYGACHMVRHECFLMAAAPGASPRQTGGWRCVTISSREPRFVITGCYARGLAVCCAWRAAACCLLRSACASRSASVLLAHCCLPRSACASRCASVRFAQFFLSCADRRS